MTNRTDRDFAGCPHCGGHGYATGCGPGTGFDDQPCHAGPYGNHARKSEASRLWVLGASDPEMAAIETLLREAEERVAYAAAPGKDGTLCRVHPGNAYQSRTAILLGRRCRACGGVEDVAGPIGGLTTDDAQTPGGLGGCGDLHDFAVQEVSPLDCDEVVLVECGFDRGHPWEKTGSMQVFSDPQCGYVLYPSSGCEEFDHSLVVSRVDHHRPGDPGYGRPPEEFLEASSIGQVVLALAGKCRRLALSAWTAWPSNTPGLPGRDQIGLLYGRWVLGTGPTHASEDDAPELVGCDGVFELSAEAVFTAAADHCLEAAYRGKCPGVNPDALMQWRAESRATFRKQKCRQCAGTGWMRGDHEHDEQARCSSCSVEAVLADVDAARKRLREAVGGYCPLCGDKGGWHAYGCQGVSSKEEYADLRGEHIPELPEAAAREGIPFLATVTEFEGRRKMVLQAAPPELVRRFLAGELTPGLAGEKYGDPARGMAGWYIS